MTDSLFEKLKELKESERYPFHMPGHKRNFHPPFPGNPYEADITEIEGFDDLHYAEGVLLQIEKNAAAMYGADEAHLLVNGSTCGNLAAISAVSSGNEGEHLLCARNVHRSVSHAMVLRRLTPEFMDPEDTGYGFAGELRTGEIAKKAKTSCCGVFVTSPTYEGVISRIPEITEKAHERDLPLIVDCAHGAHLGLSEVMPENPVTQGADITVVSLHKTLAALTQSALLLVKGDRVDREKLKFFLNVYQTSSPSYLLMGSMDACLRDIQENGKERFATLLRHKERLLEEKTKYIRILGTDIIQDPCKAVILCGDGYALKEQMLEEHNIDAEMAGAHHVVLLLSPYDTEEGLTRLLHALTALDKPENAFL